MFQQLKELTKKRIEFAGQLLKYDMHGHWIPGIDDGASSVQESLEMLSVYVSNGYSELIATPHIYRDYYPNTGESIQAAFTMLKPEAIRLFPELKIGFAAEYYLDDYFEQCLSAKELLTFKGNHVLVEQGYFAETPGIDKYLFDTQIKGYTPVLAHPERYVYYHHTNRKIAFMRELGIKMQINLLSLAGKYGPEIAKKANEYLEKGWVDFIGTDAHSSEDLLLLKKIKLSSKALKAWQKITEQEKL